VLGIALALVGCYVLMTQIEYSKDYNKCFKNYERLYRIDIWGLMGEGWGVSFPRPIIEKFAECPHVESIGYIGWEKMQILDKNGEKIITTLYSDNGKLLSTLGIDILDGNPDDNLKEGTMIIPESMAIKYFGETMVAGRQITLNDGSKATVVAVYRDFSLNSEIKNNCISYLGDENMDSDNNWSYITYVRANPNTSHETLEQSLSAIFKEYVDRALDGQNVSDSELESVKKMRIGVIPLTETSFCGHDQLRDRGNITVMLILQLAIALLIIVSTINFANYSMAMAPMRLRGIITRKIMGESDCGLVTKILGENLLVTTTAFLLSLLIDQWLGASILGATTINGTLGIASHTGIMILVFVASVIIGLPPTLQTLRYYTSFQPVEALKGSIGNTTKGKRTRYWLVGLQFVASFVLTILISLLYCQTDYIYSSDYGYDKDAILVGDTFTSNIPQSSKEAIRSELEKLPCVENVSYSNLQPGTTETCMQWTRIRDNDVINFRVICVDWKFFRTHGIDILEGRDFKEADADVCIINKAMKDRIQSIKIDQPLFDNDFDVVGVCDNFRAFSTRVNNSSEAVAFVIFGPKYKDWGDQRYCFSIRIANNASLMEARRQISSTIEEISLGVKPDLKFLNDQLEQVYQGEMKFTRQIQLSSMLILLITLIGVFCLTMFETEYRRKEIAIRKVMGSTVGEVLVLLAQRYALPLIISFVIAAPLAYYIGAEWLQNFAERTPIHWWIFPLSFVTVSFVVLTTVIAQSYRVATMNPYESIRTE